MSRFVIVLLFAATLSFSACTNASEKQPSSTATTAPTLAPPPQSQGSGAMPTVTYQNPSVDRTEKGKPVGSPFMPELLQEIFPLDAGGLNRYSGANGIPKLLDNQTGTQSRIVYKNPGSDSQISMTIIDSGTLGLTMDQIVSWIKNPRNVETDNTIDRTGALKGFPYYESYLKDVQEGELHLLVNRRFEVIVAGEQVPYETLRKVMEDLDLASLF